MIEGLEAEARVEDLGSLFAFAYVSGFFRKLGFEEVDRGELPLKAWKDCLRCPKFQACDEIAMLKRLKPEAQAVPVHGPEEFMEILQLPILRKCPRGLLLKECYCITFLRIFPPLCHYASIKQADS